MKPFKVSIRSLQFWLALLLPLTFFACQEDVVVNETSKAPTRKPQFDAVDNYQPLKSPHFVPIEEAAEIAYLGRPTRFGKGKSPARRKKYHIQAGSIKQRPAALLRVQLREAGVCNRVCRPTSRALASLLRRKHLRFG